MVRLTAQCASMSPDTWGMTIGVTGPKWGPIASWTDSFSGYIPIIMKNQSVCGQLSWVRVKVFRVEMAVGFEISCGREWKQLDGDKRPIWLDGSGPGFPTSVPEEAATGRRAAGIDSGFRAPVLLRKEMRGYYAGREPSLSWASGKNGGKGMERSCLLLSVWVFISRVCL